MKGYLWLYADMYRMCGIHVLALPVFDAKFDYITLLKQINRIYWRRATRDASRMEIFSETLVVYLSAVISPVLLYCMNELHRTILLLRTNRWGIHAIGTQRSKFLSDTQSNNPTEPSF